MALPFRNRHTRGMSILRVPSPFAFCAKGGALRPSPPTAEKEGVSLPCPGGLNRYQHTGNLHFITFGCHRAPH